MASNRSLRVILAAVVIHHAGSGTTAQALRASDGRGEIVRRVEMMVAA